MIIIIITTITIIIYIDHKTTVSPLCVIVSVPATMSKYGKRFLSNSAIVVIIKLSTCVCVWEREIVSVCVWRGGGGEQRERLFLINFAYQGCVRCDRKYGLLHDERASHIDTWEYSKYSCIKNNNNVSK